MPLTFFGPRDVNTTLPVRLNDPVSMQCFVFSGSNSSESCTEKDCLTWYMRRHYTNGTMGMPSEIPDDGRFEALTNRLESMLWTIFWHPRGVWCFNIQGKITENCYKLIPAEKNQEF